MTENDRDQFELAWLQAAETYGRNAIPTDGALNLVFNALAPFELGEIVRALSAHISNPDEGRFAPKIADIVRHIKGDNSSKAQVAWAKVVDTIKRIGPYESVVFDDRITMAVIRDMGGWQKINEIGDKDLPYRQQDFMVMYKGYLNNPPASHPKQFIGLLDAENQRNGHAKEPQPLLIGDPMECLEVFNSGDKCPPKVSRLSDLIAANEKPKIANQQNPTLKPRMDGI